MWRADDPQGNEAAKIKYDIVPYTRGRGLDLGCGPNKAFPHFIGVDNGHHNEAFGWQARPDVTVETAEKLDMFASQSLDFVFSSHLLEHIENYPKALKEWFRVIKIGGYLVLYLPDDEQYPKVGEVGANPDHKWNVNYTNVLEAMKAIKGWDLIKYEKRDHDNGPGEYGNEYSLYFVFKKINSAKQLLSFATYPKPKKTVCVVRYGGFGDMLQLTSVLPILKAQGFHVTVMTTPRGQEILAHDPHIDAFLVQDTNQVPNNELRAYWNYWTQKFTKLINLSESVEVMLLPTSGQTMYHWSQDARHAILNVNYQERVHAIADVAGPYSIKFYPSEDEKAWAKKEHRALGRGKVILWTLAGSSVHKTWPHQDQLIARILLTMPDVKIVLTGDTLCQLLEQGWEKEERVILRSGQWSIRQTLAFAQQADLVIGPETGVTNAVSHEPMAKVVMLSHSSEENFTKHWVNTTALLPENTPCYPCHRMHYTFEFCHRDEETGTALCQANISTDKAYKAVRDALYPLQLEKVG